LSDGLIESALARDRWFVGAALAALTGLAWLWLWRDWAAMTAMDPAMACMAMPGMDMSGLMACPDHPALYIAQAFLMWLIMMVAMMLPSAAPMILLYAKVARGPRGAGAALAPTAAFAGAYVVVWGAFSALAAGAQWALVRSGAASDASLALGQPRVAGLLLVAAGLYQATGLKRECLDTCRSPLSFIMQYWRNGWLGSARLGFTHGLYCLGCCAMLMTLLFVFGVMNLLWVAVLAALVVVEKLAPFGGLAAQTIGVAAVVLGGAMVVGAWPL